MHQKTNQHNAENKMIARNDAPNHVERRGSEDTAEHQKSRRHIRRTEKYPAKSHKMKGEEQSEKRR